MAVEQLKQGEFDTAVAEGKVLLDFYADWCGPCRMLGPVVEEVSEELAASCRFFRINVDEDPALALKFGINLIPTLILLENGEKKNSATGYMSKEELLSFLNA